MSTILSLAIGSLQRYAGGEIRQVGVLSCNARVHIAQIHAECKGLEYVHMPLSVVLARQGVLGNVAVSGTAGSYVFSPEPGGQNSVATLAMLLGEAELPPIPGFEDYRNLSEVVSCDLAPAVLTKLGTCGHYGAVGLALGAISAAAVNESIAWVQKFPLGLEQPGFISGDLLKDVALNIQATIDENRYLFVCSHVGDADCYFNDSHTFAPITSDYAYIENVRTMDKACRGIRTNLLPYLNSPLRVDATTGKLDVGTVAFLQTTAGKALEDMEKAGELSGYTCEIDPDQNILSTSRVEVVIKQVGVGVMRKVTVKIGYTTKIE